MGHLPLLQYYYMGYYIHDCDKMNYKGSYYPSSLLDVRIRSWVPLEQCLDDVKSRRFNAPLPLSEERELRRRVEIEVLPRVRVLSRGQLISATVGPSYLVLPLI